MNLQGLAAVVTGGASGLGAATAKLLAEGGCKVAVLDINEAAAQASAARFGGIGIACDVSDGPSGEAAMAAARAAHGPCRILVNCAGVGTAGRIIGRNGPLALEAFERVIRINLIGTFNMLRLAAEAMLKNEPDAGGERGVIVNTASVAAYEGQLGQAAYAASKGGIVALTLPVARELARSGIRCMTIAPGIMETPMLLGMPAEVQDALNKMVPFPTRMGKPAEYAALVRHIAENAYLNGEVIRLDGAIRMGAK